jgi:hypothetical protein
MNTATETLLAFWKHPRNIPFKGDLISDDSLNLNEGEEPTTCMCAQGQALYMIGGYSEEDLRNTKQDEADKEVAKLLGISVAHSVLLRKINDGQDGAPSDVLTNPEKYLGKNHKAVLDFWWYMDSLTEPQWEEVVRRYYAARGAALDAARDAARVAAWDAARDAARVAAWDAAWYAARDAAWYAARYATYELMGGIENPVFVPLFDNLNP